MGECAVVNLPVSALPQSAGGVRRVSLPGGGPVVELAPIPAGPFLMGDVLGRSPEADTRPAHEVELDAFALARTAVTNEQFAWFVARTGYRTTREVAGHAQVWTRYALPGREQYPVICVNWIDAAAFATWAGLRLPTEAEWEKGARGGPPRGGLPLGGRPPPRGRRGARPLQLAGGAAQAGAGAPQRAGLGADPGGQLPAQRLRPLRHQRQRLGVGRGRLHPGLLRRAAPAPIRLGPAQDVNGLPCPPVRWRGDDHLLVPPRSVRAIRGGAWDNNIFGLRCCERIAAGAGTHNKSTVSGFRVAA